MVSSGDAIGSWCGQCKAEQPMERGRNRGAKTSSSAKGERIRRCARCRGCVRRVYPPAQANERGQELEDEVQGHIRVHDAIKVGW